MPFSQDPIGSVSGSANAITAWSGLIPRRGLIGQWFEVGGCYCSVVQAFIDPPRNTDQHLVVVSQFLIFPMGLVKIAVGCPASPPTSRSCPHGASFTEEWKNQELYFYQTHSCTQHVICAKCTAVTFQLHACVLSLIRCRNMQRHHKKYFCQ